MKDFFLSSHFSWYFDRSESDNPCLYFYISMSAKKCGKSLKFMCLLFYVLHPLRWQRCAFSLPQEVTRIANVQWLSFSSIITMITSVQCFFFGRCMCQSLCSVSLISVQVFDMCESDVADMLLEELAQNSQTSNVPAPIPPKTLQLGASVKSNNTTQLEQVITFQTNSVSNWI